MANYLQEILNKLQSISQPTPADWIGAIATAISAFGAIVAAIFAVLAYIGQNKRLQKQEEKMDKLEAWEEDERRYKLIQKRRQAALLLVNSDYMDGGPRNGILNGNPKHISERTVKLTVTIKNLSAAPISNIAFHSNTSFLCYPIPIRRDSPSYIKSYVPNESAQIVLESSGKEAGRIDTVIYNPQFDQIDETSMGKFDTLEPGDESDLVIFYDFNSLSNKEACDLNLKNSFITFTDENGLSWKKPLKGSLIDITEYPEVN